VLFSFLAGVTKTLGYTTGVIILPQRQTALFGKQAANLDNFCGGRLQVGVGIGWNEIEYEALGMPFTERGERLDDQILFLRRLWTEPTFSHTSKFHRLSDGGIKPLPLQQPIPILVGGVSQAALKRAARLGDGWLPVLPATAADEKIAELHEAVHAAGRDPAHVPLENIVFLGKTLGGPVRTAEDGAADAFAWKKAGAQAVCFHTMGMGFASLDEHMALLRQIADMLGLKQKG
jgi:probable F420-dependent oxidoreductase